MMKNLFTTLAVLLTLSLTLPITSLAQRSMPGIPQSSLYKDLPLSIDQHTFQAPDMDLIRAEDEAEPTKYRVGVAVPVNLDMQNAGSWTELPNGGKIWRLSIEVEGAEALGVYYDNFWLPYGGELYLYNQEKSHMIGAFTEYNNSSDCVFANQLVEGDKVILEYYQPESQAIEPVISISEVAYNYRGVEFEFSPDGGSAWCMINVNCPEGDNWQDEKRGVVKQFMKIGWSYYLCSGTLVNNTEQDLTPYVLTAFHCGEGGSAADLNQWVFYFNYEAATCTGTYGPSNYSMTGCTKKAEGSYTTGSDFLLIELNYNVPGSYNAFFNGWNRRAIAADSGVSIHHPAGDIKKISTYTDALTSSQWNGNGVLSHWKVWWAETENGTSITEGGSSGSPIFDQNKHVVGDLTGGPADDCTNPLYSLYGKVYWSWDHMGTQPAQQLKPWLDPGNYGVYSWDGIYEASAPSPAFTADQTILQVGGIVNFENLTTGNPLEWEWTFDGGSPASYTGETPPEVTYNTPGIYDVILETSNTIGSATADSVGMIRVGAPTADFSATNNYLHSGESTDFMDESDGDPIAWSWTFEGGTPETSNEQNPTGIEYSAQGTYDVTLEVENQYGTGIITKEDYVVVDGPFAEFEANYTYVLVGEPVSFTDMSTNNPTSWNWKFFGGSPGSFSGQNPPEVVYNAPGSYDVKLTVTNDLGSNFVTKTDYIQVGNVGVEEQSLEESIDIFPNPSHGNITLKLGDNGLAGGYVHILNAGGELIRSLELTDNSAEVAIDLSVEPAGIYLVRISKEDNTVNRKVTLVK